MITIRDEKKLLNLKQTEIYFLLTSVENVLYAQKLKYLSFVKDGRRFFHFNIVVKGEEPYSEFKNIITGAASSCNVIVRLVDHIHGIYFYGLDVIDLTQSLDALRKSISEFIDQVCKENMNQLEVLMERHTSTSIDAMRRYKNEGIICEEFRKILNHENPGTAGDQLLQRENKTTDRDESLAIIQGAVDNTMSGKLAKEYCERIKPDRHPDITVTIKKVPTGQLRRSPNVACPKTMRTAYGVEFYIDGIVVPVYFGNADMTMLYIAALLKQKDGTAIKKNNFTSHGDKSIKEWLHMLYNKLAMRNDFSHWFEAISANEAHRINDAKAKINTALWKVLCDEFKDAYHYCFIETSGARSRDSHYKIRIYPEDILMEDIFMELLSNSNQ